MEKDKLDEDIVEQIGKWYKKSKESSEKWRKEAVECHDFVAGNQWDESDIQKLKKEERPIVTFNWIGPMIAVILGIEANQRNEVHFEPREVSDSGLIDALNLFGKFLRDATSIDQEEAEIFEDVVISGMGWSETLMDYDDDLDGEFKQIYANAIDMYWDPSARKRNLVDRRWQIHAKKMTKEAILEMWPDAELNLDTPEDKVTDLPVVIDNPADRYEDKGVFNSDYKKENEFTVLRAQWYEKKKVYRAQDPTSGQIIEMSTDAFKKIKPILEMGNAQYVKQDKKNYYQAFVVGKELLEYSKAPSQKTFTYACITGKRDKINNSWYGIVRAMRDPQKWSNKFFSQIMDIIQSNAKGGILVEQDTFIDQRKAEEEWAKSDSIIYTKPGSLAQNKIMPKPTAAYPTGLDKLMNFAISSIRGVSGINLEVLGLAEREQAGVLEQMRKTSAFTILAVVFDALKNYRKIAGLLMIDFITNYIPVQKIEAVLGPEDKKYAQLIKTIDMKMTDIVVSEGASSENNKIMVWSFFSQMLPTLLKMGIPVPPEVLDYSPLPATLVSKWKQMIEQRMAGPPMQQGQQNPQQQSQPVGVG